MNFWSFFLLCHTSHVVAISQFSHPGIQFSLSTVETFRRNALSGDPPWAIPYTALQSQPGASSSYQMLGPHPQAGRGTGNNTIQQWSEDWDSDMSAIYLNSLMYAITKEDSYAQKVAQLVDGWVSELTYFNNDNLAACIGGRNLVSGAEMVRYLRGSWPSGDSKFEAAQQFTSRLLVPSVTMQANPPSQPAVGGNQGFCTRISRLEFAVFTNNYTGFEAEMNILKQPRLCEAEWGTGVESLFLPATGQPAEAGRDQGHTANDVSWFEEMAQVAANQNDYSLFQFPSEDPQQTPLLMLAMEYYFKYNTGSNNLPFNTQFGPCCCGTVTYSELSTTDRNNTYPVGEIGYRWYTQLGYNLPYTREWLEQHRGVPISETTVEKYLGLETLTWAQGNL